MWGQEEFFFTFSHYLVVRKVKKGIAKVEIKVGPMAGVTPITHSLSWTHLMWQLGPEPITQLVGKGCNAHFTVYIVT